MLRGGGDRGNDLGQLGPIASKRRGKCRAKALSGFLTGLVREADGTGRISLRNFVACQNSIW